MKKLIILSDLWGTRKSTWINNYETLLRSHFNVVIYDSRELGEIDLRETSEHEIHKQFLDGGIDKAARSLLEKEENPTAILGFSIGGQIAWKALLSGLKTENLTAVSSTRLRFETQRPTCVTNLFYGENDDYKPEKDWFDSVAVKRQIFAGESHDFYTKSNVANAICRTILNQMKPKR